MTEGLPTGGFGFVFGHRVINAINDWLVSNNALPSSDDAKVVVH